MDDKVFRKWKKAVNMSNSDAARLLEISPRTCANYANGHTDIPFGVEVICFTVALYFNENFYNTHASEKIKILVDSELETFKQWLHTNIKNADEKSNIHMQTLT